MAAAALGSRILRQAADAYDRAARSPYGRIPPPTPAGNRLRQAARLLSAFAYLTHDRSLAPIVLITKLAALAEAVAELRDAQQHAAQAAAARAAAERLYAAARPAPPAQPRPAPHASTAAQLAGLSFPSQHGPPRSSPHPDSPAPVKAARRQHAGRHHHGHAAPAANPLRRNTERATKEDHGSEPSRAVGRGHELQLPARRPRLSTLITSSANKPVGGHQDLSTDGHQAEATVITESE